MKFHLKSLLFGVALVALLTYSGCGPGSGNEPSVEEVQLGKMKSTWTISAVTLDTDSKITDYPGFKLTLEGTAGNPTFNYSTQSRPSLSPWPAGGTWKFGADASNTILRDSGSDEVPMTYSVSDTQLQLTFNFTGTGYAARTSKVTGVWVFTFTK